MAARILGRTYLGGMLVTTVLLVIGMYLGLTNSWVPWPLLPDVLHPGSEWRLHSSTEAPTEAPAEAPEAPAPGGGAAGASVGEESPELSASPVAGSKLADRCKAFKRPPNYDYGKYFHRQYHISPVLKHLPISPMYVEVLPLLRKLLVGEPVRIIVLGGSETSGRNCSQRIGGTGRELAGKECAWPDRLKRWLESNAPKASVRMDNYAQGGGSSEVLAGISVLLDKQRDANTDMIFLDTLVNDVYEPDTASVSYEQLIRTLYKLLPNTPIFAFLAGCGACHLENHLKVIRHYFLPKLDYWDVVEKEQDLWIAPDGLHPRWFTHQSMADALAMVMAGLWQEECDSEEHGLTFKVPPRFWPKQPLAPAEQLEAFPVCEEAASAYSAYHPSKSSMPTVASGNWTLYEDQPGEPGWITQQLGSKLRFRLRFGETPRLVVTWLTFREGLGDVVLTLSGLQHRLSGLQPDRTKVPMPHSQWFQAAGQDGSSFNLRPNTVADLDVELVQGAKFKIIEIVTC